MHASSFSSCLFHEALHCKNERLSNYSRTPSSKTVKWLQPTVLQNLQHEEQNELQYFHAVKKLHFILDSQQNYLHLGEVEKPTVLQQQQ